MPVLNVNLISSGTYIIINMVTYSSKCTPNIRGARCQATKGGKEKYNILGCRNGTIAEIWKGLHATVQETAVKIVNGS